MTSRINPNSIDITFPISNQDNNSQGFRDNFTNIRNNLVYAKAEITELQDLTASANVSFTMSNHQHWTSNVTTMSSAINQLADRLFNAGF